MSAISLVLTANQPRRSSLQAYGAAEIAIGKAEWKFDVLDRIRASQAAIDAATAASGGSYKPKTSHNNGDLDGDKDSDGKDKDPNDPVVPEPATLLLLATGICLLGAVHRRRLIPA
jgi:hypothetical protein